MTSFSRADDSLLSRWWWTVDRWSLIAVGALLAVGAVLALAASPAVAERIGLDESYFIRRHMVFLPAAIALVVGTSLLSPVQVRRLALVAFAAALVLLVATLFVGTEIKGARRWLGLFGFSLQATEFIKPAFAVAAAWLFTEQVHNDRLPGNLLVAVLFAIVLGLVAAQPDVGQAVVIAGVWMSQFFLAGLSTWLVIALAVLAIAGAATAYLTLPHVASRIDRFLDPASGDTYQVERSLEAFMNGGLFGRGPGEGTVKTVLPDAHADFVFAVIGEEFGMVLSLGVVALFALIVLRGMARAFSGRELFVLLATAGLLIQFALQALINMGSTLNLMPTKGMTLPFVSYGGSSLLATAFAIGMVLALTRKRADKEAAP